MEHGGLRDLLNFKEDFQDLPIVSKRGRERATVLNGICDKKQKARLNLDRKMK